MIISSRQVNESQQFANEYPNNEITIRIIVDRMIDPPEIRILRESIHSPNIETLMINTGDEEILSLVDLMQVLDRLGFQVLYDEV